MGTRELGTCMGIVGELFVAFAIPFGFHGFPHFGLLFADAFSRFVKGTFFAREIVLRISG